MDQGNGLVFEGGVQQAHFGNWVWYVADQNEERWSQGICGDRFLAEEAAASEAESWNSRYQGLDPYDLYALLMSGPKEELLKAA